MIKPIDLKQRLTKLTIIKDGKKVAEVFIHGAEGYIDTDGFKRVETITEPINMCVNVRIEV